VRLVLDTDVMVAAIRSDAGASRLLLNAALQNGYVLLASVPLMIEYESVMTREEHLAVSGLSAREVHALLDGIAAVAKPVQLVFLWRPVLRDPNDDMVLETAVNGDADVLVTFNQRDFAEVAKRFSVRVCLPAQAVRLLEKRDEKE
jgi:putative PIN family toxin of toxin-antitoxin system